MSAENVFGIRPDNPSIPEGVRQRADGKTRWVTRATDSMVDWECLLGCDFCTTRFGTGELVPPLSIVLNNLETKLPENPGNHVIDMNSREELNLVDGWQEMLGRAAGTGANIVISTRDSWSDEDLQHVLEAHNKVSDIGSVLVMMVTIPALNNGLIRQIERNTITPRDRIEFAKELKEMGIPVVIDMTPAYPQLSDDEMLELLQICKASGIVFDMGSLYLPESEMQKALELPVEVSGRRRLGLMMNPHPHDLLGDNSFVNMKRAGYLSSWEPSPPGAVYGGQEAWNRHVREEGVTWKYTDPRIGLMFWEAQEIGAIAVTSYMEAVAWYQHLASQENGL